METFYLLASMTYYLLQSINLQTHVDDGDGDGDEDDDKRITDGIHMSMELC